MNNIKILVSAFSVLVRQGRYVLSFKKDQVTDFHLAEKIYMISELFMNLRSQLSLKGLVITLMLSLMVMMSAIGVVQSSHLSRQLFAEQALLMDRNDQLQLEWAQLLLEQSAWSSPNRLEGIAIGELNMHVPDADAISLIE